MKVKKMCDALDYWSPRGLCRDVLVEANGDHRKSIGCAVGALTREVLSKPEGKAALKAEAARIKKEDNRDYSDDSLDAPYGGEHENVRSSTTFIKGMISSSLSNLEKYPILRKAVYKYFDMTPMDEGRIMSCNDNDNGNESDNRNLPKTLVAKILNLRQRYEDWMSKSEEKA